MPQLDFATFASQLVWLAISFVILYVAMARVALPRIATVIEERRDRVADDLDQAESLKKQTDEAIASYEAALAEARSKAHAIAGQMRDELNAESERQRGEVETKLAKETGEAEARIREATEAALANVREVASETAGLIVEQLLGKTVDATQTAAAVAAEITRDD